MQTVPKDGWTSLPRQFPKNSRIQLTRDGDGFSVLPGSTGKLDYSIDDAGQFHAQNWDNGRTLVLVLGEDDFSSLPRRAKTLKLYMHSHRRLLWPGRVRGSVGGWRGVGWPPSWLMRAHCSALVKSDAEKRERRMHWYGERDSVDHKVRSAAVFWVRSGTARLWGVAECRVAAS